MWQQRRPGQRQVTWPPLRLQPSCSIFLEPALVIPVMATTTIVLPPAIILAIPTRTTMEIPTIIPARAMDLPASIPAKAMDQQTTIRVRVTIPAAAIIPPRTSWELREAAMVDMEAMEAMCAPLSANTVMWEDRQELNQMPRSSTQQNPQKPTNKKRS